MYYEVIRFIFLANFLVGCYQCIVSIFRVENGANTYLRDVRNYLQDYHNPKDYNQHIQRHKNLKSQNTFSPLRTNSCVSYFA
jgi:hypothetical protein